MAGALLGVLMLFVVVPFAWWRGDGPLGGGVGGDQLAGDYHPGRNGWCCVALVV